MTLSEFFRREGPGAKSRLHRESGIAYSTLHWIERGVTRPRADTAQKIERATDGAVTAVELLGLTEPSDEAAE